MFYMKKGYFCLSQPLCSVSFCSAAYHVSWPSERVCDALKACLLQPCQTCFSASLRLVLLLFRAVFCCGLLPAVEVVVYHGCLGFSEQ